jgi:hypothetical protein
MKGSVLYRKEMNSDKVKTVPTYVVIRPEVALETLSTKQ